MAERAGMVKTEFANGGSKWFSPHLEDGTIDPTPRGVRKGEKSTEIIKWLFLEKAATDENGKPITKKDGSPLIKRFAVPRIFHVFNADQCEFPEDSKGVPAMPAPQEDDKTPIEVAEALVASYLEGGPSLGHGGDSAFYRPSADHVQMPEFADFTSAEAYYSTLYHELTHSTGHDSREAREGVAKGTFGPFGSEVYSQEELVAEIGAAFLCGIAGIAQEATFNNSVAYIKHWLGALKDDKNLIIRAGSQAQKAVDRILGTTFQEDEDETQEGGE
jgi:antirestriction protein ArdC